MAINSKDKKHNCWEYMECPKNIREKCEAYKRGLGKDCWFVQKGEGTGCFAFNTYNGCINCPWYKRQNPE